MTLHNVKSSAIFLLILFEYATAQVLFNCDGAASAHMVDLQLKQCAVDNNLTKRVYRDEEVTAPYATEFDRRTVVVVSGSDPKAVRAASGLIGHGRGFSIEGSKLVQPPMKQQISSREALKASLKHRQWIVLTERVQYAAQGGAPGYVIDCATAWSSTPEITTAVGECFALEERSRFYQTLDLLN